MTEDSYRGDPNDPMTLNYYTYGANNPLRYIDPTGHWNEDSTWWNPLSWGNKTTYTEGTYKSEDGSTTTTYDLTRKTNIFGQIYYERVNNVVETNNVNDHFDELIGYVLNVEGGFVDHPNDKGGATNRGITINTFKLGAKEHLGIEPTIENLKSLTVEQAKTLYRKMYWEPMGGSQIENKQVAHIMFDMAVNSGVKTAARYMQKTLNQMGNSLDIDGVVGTETLKAINTANSEKLFNDFKTARSDFYKAIIAKDPTQKVFEKGWMNRINSFVYNNEREDIP